MEKIKLILMDYRLFRLYGNSRILSIKKAILMATGHMVHVYPNRQSINLMPDMDSPYTLGNIDTLPDGGIQIYKAPSDRPEKN